MHSTHADWNALQREVEEKLRQKPADDVKKRITIPDPVPAGNRLAHFIRSIHWNSKGMLPSTAGSQRTYDKYNTVTSLSFQGPDGFEIKPGEASGGFQRKRETVEDVMNSPRTQIFNRWKIPDRMLESAPPAPITPAIPLDLQPDVVVHTPSIPPTPLNVPALPLSARAAPKDTIGKAPVLPMSARPAAPKAATGRQSKLSREMSLPNIKMRPTPVPRVESRNGLQPSRGPKSARGSVRSIPPTPQLPQRSKTMCVDTRKNSPPEFNMGNVPLDYALQPEAVPQAHEWMKHADKADKKVIERILKMASKKHQLENSLNKTLLPDAKGSVEKWLKDANENERQVALNFFGSLAGGQLMGMTVDSQRKRLKEVIDTLEDTKPGIGFARKKNTRRKKETISDGNLKYVRLLTPNTRDNRWMHTTWHHLPQYKDDDVVNNWSSHYIRPHAGIPRHFVIHPDWG